MENPLREGIRLERTPDPCVMIIFGASGDLTKRKLMPALYNLWRERFLPAGFSVVGFSRTDMNDAQYRAAMKQAVEQFGDQGPLNSEAWDNFAEGLFYLSAHPGHPEDYASLASRLEEIDRQRGTNGNRIYYLAVPPSSFAGIVQQLDAAGLAQGEKGWRRLIIEKPFGHDLQSARELNQSISKVFREEQIYRIDHYLGKETVQNILVFRFANGIFEPVWNRRYVDNVQITAAENIGIGSRGAYYEEAGALRDMIQNHVLQLLTLVAMEPPPDFEPNSVRDEKAKVLRSMRPIDPGAVNEVAVRGQYGPGFISGKPVPGYRQEH